MGLNPMNFNFTRHLPWVEKFPVAVENSVLFVMVFFRCLTADWLTSVALAPEWKSALRDKYSSFSLFIFSFMKLIGTNLEGSVRCLYYCYIGVSILYELFKHSSSDLKLNLLLLVAKFMSLLLESTAYV